MQTNHKIDTYIYIYICMYVCIYIYLECDFNYKNFQRTSPICPAYHPTSQTIY